MRVVAPAIRRTEWAPPDMMIERSGAQNGSWTELVQDRLLSKRTIPGTAFGPPRRGRSRRPETRGPHVASRAGEAVLVAELAEFDGRLVDLTGGPVNQRGAVGDEGGIDRRNAELVFIRGLPKIGHGRG